MIIIFGNQLIYDNNWLINIKQFKQMKKIKKKDFIFVDSFF